MNNEVILAYALSNIFDRNMAAVAGVMANMKVESGYQANNLQNSYNKSFGLTDEEYTQRVDVGTIDGMTFAHDHAGYGLCQWTHWSRKQDFYQYMKKYGHSVGSLSGQIDYLYYDLKEHYMKLFNKLLVSKTPDEACRYFMLEYEKPANQTEENIAKRCAIAIDIYQKITSDETKKANIKAAISVIEMQLDIIKENLKECE